MDASLRAALDAAVAPGFELLGSPVTPLEVAAFVLSLWMVACNLRVNPLGWPLAIVSSLLYGWLFLHSRLYGEASLQLLFVALAGWGWWQWLRGRADDGQTLQVGWLSARQRLLAAALTLAAWPLVGLLLQRATDTVLKDTSPLYTSPAPRRLYAEQIVDSLFAAEAEPQKSATI